MAKIRRGVASGDPITAGPFTDHLESRKPILFRADFPLRVLEPAAQDPAHDPSGGRRPSRCDRGSHVVLISGPTGFPPRWCPPARILRGGGVLGTHRGVQGRSLPASRGARARASRLRSSFECPAETLGLLLFGRVRRPRSASTANPVTAGHRRHRTTRTKRDARKARRAIEPAPRFNMGGSKEPLSGALPSGEGMTQMRSAEPPRGRSGSPSPRARVLVVGASGFLGRAVVRALTEEGLEVHGLVRDSAKGECVRENGGIPFLGDVLDPSSLRGAARGCASAIHLAAHPSRDEDEARVRVEGARRLLEVARAEGLGRVIVGSGYWVYRGQPEWIDEESPVDPRGESRTNFDAERVGLEANAPGVLEVLVVRPGMVYGDGSWFRSLALSVRSGEYSVIGEGRNRWSFVSLPDCASAFARVLESGVGGGVYNVVDGSPASLREFVDFVAAQMGAAPPRSVTREAVEAELGETVAHHLVADRPTSNQKLTGLGWRPRFATYRDGVPAVIREIFPREAGSRR